VAEPRKSRRLRSDHEDSAAARAVRVLVIEDDPDLCGAVCDLLGSSGYEAWAAADGIAALELLSDGVLPDVILLDLMLPRMDGWKFRERQLGDPRLKDIPVIVVSAVGEIVQSISASCLLRKPVAPAVLLESIERYRRH
jgi:two-component system, chemotaxis family, chemotaxis protein CheY